MLSSHPLAKRFGYSGLLTAVFALMFIGPLFSGDQWETLVIGVLVILTSGFAIYAAGNSLPKQVFLGILAVIYVGSHFVHGHLGELDWLIVHRAAGAVLFAIAALVLLQNILSARSNITGELIAGSIVVYLLLGIVFAYLFNLVEMFSPGSFTFVDRAGFDDPDFFYFSLVTLTTLGYGDVAPLAPMARGLATLEAVIGPLYLTVLVARLVGMHINLGSSESGGQK